MANLPTTDITTGLTDDQVKQSRLQHGANTLTPPERDPLWKQFIEKFNDPTIIILLVAAAISILITVLEMFVLKVEDATFIDSIAIFLAVLIATLAGFLSELKSAREFDLLNKVKDDILIKVLRNGTIHEVSINEIVVGDVVQLHLGDKIPADGYVTESFGLLVDQSVMTGESVPVEKTADDRRQTAGETTDNRRQTTGGETDGIAVDSAAVCRLPSADSEVYRGTMVSDGRGQFVVTHVGDKTRLGQIAANLGDSESETPLVQKLTKLAHQISLFGMITAGLIFVVMSGLAFWSWTPDWTDGTLAALLPLLKGTLSAFIIAVAVIVVAVPEGLPMMVTMALALNMMKMAKENCLIRKLVASETIGSATVICSDKTGTLTQNQMTVTWLFADGRQQTADGSGSGSREVVTVSPLLAEAIAVNTDASLDFSKNEAPLPSAVCRLPSPIGIGNPTECAMLRLLHDAGMDYREVRKQSPHVWELGHNSARKMSLVAVNKGDMRVIYAKGAPERLLGCCSHVLVNGQPEPMETHRAAIDAALVRAQDQALRVIAVTMKQSALSEVPESFQESHAERFAEYSDNTLLALIGISDPIREEVPQAVATCHAAGINVKMITGDAKPTAIAIAKQAGILQRADGRQQTAGEDVVLTSEELEKLSDDELVEVIPRLKVVARSTPMDKLRLVKAMHRQGEVVAMTGDGTNDAPALKFADVGISMGITGTEVAKEASDIVLVDDNFKSIVTGVWWGRTLYQNIQRFLVFQLTVNVVALFLVFFGPLFGIPMPFTVVQLLWINIIMDTFAALALCTEPPRRNSMERKPIPREASIITAPMGLTIILTALYQVAILGSLLCLMSYGWFLSEGSKLEFWQDMRYEGNLEALTVFFTAFVLFHFWNFFNCRAMRWGESPFAMLDKNKAFLVIVVAIALIQICVVQGGNVLGIGEIFRTTALQLWQWGVLVLITATIIPAAYGIRFIVHSLGLYGEKYCPASKKLESVDLFIPFCYIVCSHAFCRIF